MKTKLKAIISILLCFVILLLNNASLVYAKSNIPIKSFKLSKTQLILDVGESFNLKVTYSPSNTTQKELKYSSSNKSVAVVDKTGTIKAVSSGCTSITVQSVSNKKLIATCSVTCNDVSGGDSNNLINGNLYLYDSKTNRNYYCYHDSANKGIYSLNNASKEIAKIVPDKAEYLNCANGKLYYINIEDGHKIYSVEPNGKNRKILSDSDAEFLYYLNGKLYYKNNSDNGYLYTIDENGKNEKALYRINVKSMSVSKEGIYFINAQNKYIYYASLDGSTSYILTDNTQFNGLMYSSYYNYLYAYTNNDIYVLHTYYSSEFEYVGSCSNDIVNLNVDNWNNLYYSSNNGIYRISQNGNKLDEKLLYDGDTNYLTIYNGSYTYVLFDNNKDDKLTYLYEAYNASNYVMNFKDIQRISLVLCQDLVQVKMRK